MASTTAKETFIGHIDALVAKGLARDVAVRQVVRKYPDLHKAMVADANPHVSSADIALYEVFERAG